MVHICVRRGAVVLQYTCMVQARGETDRTNDRQRDEEERRTRDTTERDATDTKGPDGHTQLLYLPLIFISSTSNFSVEFGGMTGGKPREPYACSRHRQRVRCQHAEGETRLT